MSEWQGNRLDTFFTLKRGYDLPKQSRLIGDIPIIASSGFTDYHNEAKVKESGVITGRYGTIGSVFYSDEPFWPLNTALYVNDFKGNAKRFVYYFLKTLEWEKFSDKSAVPGVNRNDVHREYISFPHLPEQKAIASVLSSLDDKIDLLHRQNKTLEGMAETLFRQWFVEEAKEDWNVYQLQDLAKLQIGRTPPRKESHWFSDNPIDIKWVSIKDLGADGIFVINSSEYLPMSTIDHFNIPIIPQGTVILSFKMTVGRVGIVIEDMVSNEAIAQFQIKKYLTTELLYCFLKQFNFDTLGSTSSIVTAVNTALLKGIQIALPEGEVIQAFTRNVKSYFDKVRANQLQIQTLEKLRDTLLPKLMSGEVRVQYQTQEVA